MFVNSLEKSLQNTCDNRLIANENICNEWNQYVDIENYQYIIPYNEKIIRKNNVNKDNKDNNIYLQKNTQNTLYKNKENHSYLIELIIQNKLFSVSFIIKLSSSTIIISMLVYIIFCIL